MTNAYAAVSIRIAIARQWRIQATPHVISFGPLRISHPCRRKWCC